MENVRGRSASIARRLLPKGRKKKESGASSGVSSLFPGHALAT